MPSPLRIVSLVPSATEAVFLIGAGHLLVGRSHECDFPPPVLSLPALTGQTTGPGTPREIDRHVRLSVESGQALYTLNTALLRELKPDVIITQDLCSVCSIDLATVRRIADGMVPRPQVISLNPQTVEDVLEDLLRLGAPLGLERRALREAVALRERLEAASDYVNPYEDGPVVAFLEWTDPLFVGGHWTVQLIERAGARHPLNPTVARPESGAAMGPQRARRTAGKSVSVPHEILCASRPERVIVCPCGFDLVAARSAAQSLLAQPWFSSLPAARSGRTAVVDGSQMFNRPGPRLADAFEWLVGWIHGRTELIPSGFPWEPAN